MKKFTSVIVVLAMLAAMVTAMIPMASAAWDGASVSVALMGSGTEYDPWIVSSENDLAFVAKQVNTGVESYEGKYLKLSADLDLGNQPWSPIGYKKGGAFRGNFDGDGHTIYNLNVKTEADGTSTLYGGVFGTVIDGVIRNLTVENATVVSIKYAGTIAGLLGCTPQTGYAAIINCHVKNAVVRGIQIGGIVGRSSQSSANKGQLEIIGCTADNVSFAPLNDDEYPGTARTNHFVGGIVGGIGATVINGCGTTNMTATVYGTSFAPCGGIVGVHGADNVNADVVNCYVIGVNITGRSDSHATKTNLGGLIGKTGHVDSVPGAVNTEANIFNCFVADVTIKNEGTSATNGIITGLMDDFIYFNHVYYIPVEGLYACGEDTYLNEYPFMTVTSLGEIKAEMLNEGNSTAVWVDDVVKGHPVIDPAAAEANEPNFVDYYVENGSDDSTTEATEESTEATDNTTAATDETTAGAVNDETTAGASDETTEAPGVPDDSTVEAKPEPEGCGSVISGAAIVIALAGVAIVFKKENF